MARHQNYKYLIRKLMHDCLQVVTILKVEFKIFIFSSDIQLLIVQHQLAAAGDKRRTNLFLFPSVHSCGPRSAWPPVQHSRFQGLLWKIDWNINIWILKYKRVQKITILILQLKRIVRRAYGIDFTHLSLEFFGYFFQLLVNFVHNGTRGLVVQLGHLT